MRKNNLAIYILFCLLILINYNIYVLPDRDGVFKKIQLVDKKIEREKSLYENRKVIAENLNKMEKSLEFFFDSKEKFSQSMSAFQKILEKNAKLKGCKFERMKWLTLPIKKKEYEVLQIDTYLKCNLEGLVDFISELRKEKKLVKSDSLNIRKERGRLRVQITFHAYKLIEKKEKL